MIAPSSSWKQSSSWKHSIETLWDLQTARAIQRFGRFCDRIRSPRQAIGIVLAVGFIALYLLAGLTVLARRDTVAPERLQLWLSGGMVVYAIYHGLKYLFSTPPDGRLTGDPATAAFGLWIGGGPIPRPVVSLHDVVRLIPATAMKTTLLCVVLFRDVPSLSCLWIGVFAALFTLEWIRRMVSQIIDALNTRERFVVRFAGILIVIALASQWALETWNATPAGGDPAEYMASGIGVLADFSMSAPVQTLAVPLQAASHLAVYRPLSWAVVIVPASWLPVHCSILLLLTAASLGTLLWWYAALDQWSIDRRHANEQSKLRTLGSRLGNPIDRSGAASAQIRLANATFPANRRGPESARSESFFGRAVLGAFATRLLSRPLPNLASTASTSSDFVGRGGIQIQPILAIATRQWHCLVRYRFNVLLSFAIPMVVSLSPLLTSGPDFAQQSTKQWIFVVGGIALSTLLLAPPALQIDFRRDLKRMWLLKSFPMSSLNCCLGMLAVPVFVTSLFQWTTLAAAYIIAAPPIGQVIWLTATLPSLALMTFATENALFLAFPHHIHDQGIAMVIRAKVTFLWKGLILAMFPVLLYIGTLGCMAVFPPSVSVVVIPVGSVIGFWTLAGLALLACVRCWTRFNPVDDMPNEV